MGTIKSFKKFIDESLWSEIQDRSAGDTVRQEEFTEEFIDKVESELISFTMSVVYYIKNYELTLDGFYKYLEENENPDEVKKIIYYIKTHKDECDKLLEKDIKFENKLLDEKVNVYLLRFVDDIVYDEKYHNTLSDIKKFASEIFKGYKRSYDFHINNKLVFKDKSELFNDYIEDKWKNSSLKQKIDDWIKDENNKISKYGFVKEPGKTISETVDDWWYSLDEDKRNDLGWDEFGDDAEEEYYTDNNPNNEYTGEDFEADEWWDAAYGIRKVKIYCSEHSKTNESIWSDIQDRSAGETVREEDKITTNKDLKNKIKELYKEQGEGDTLDVSSLTKLIKCDDFSNIFRGYQSVKHIIGLEDWDVSIVKDMNCMFMGCTHFNSDLSKWDVSSVGYMNSMFWGCENFNSNLSKWDVSSVEDMENMFWNCQTFNSDLSKWNVSSVRDMCRMFDSCINFNSDLSKWNVRRVRDMYHMFAGCINFNSDLSNWDVSNVEDMEGMFDGCKSLKQIPSWYHMKNGSDFLNESIWSDMQDRSAGEKVRKEDEMNDDDFLMLRETAKMFRNSMKRSRYASRRNTCDNFIKYIERRKEEHFWTSISDEAYDKVIRFAQKNWGDCTGIQEFMDKCLSNINECDGVPGGLTPADVGGMGSAYFPGPNGESGSGDLPSPTGMVYHQVAPFDSFVKIRKPKKKKKKKFRIEDEPCAHSKNPKVYDYVDDFRDYVDRYI